MSRPKRFIKFAGITLLTTSFYACDAYRITSGNVIDAQTNRAISGVLVRDLESEERSVKTDSNGYFNIAVMVPGIKKCSPARIEINHPGYKPLQINAPCGSENLRIRLEPAE